MKKIKQLQNIIFPDWYDELSEFEHSHKGYLSDVVVKTIGGKEYSLYFIDPSRLKQNLEDNISAGTPYYSEKNLVIILNVTKKNMINAINAMFAEGLLEDTFL